MAAITHLFAGVRVRDLKQSLPWFETFFGRPADHVEGGERLWEVSECAWIVVEEHTEHVGNARITLGVQGLDDILRRLARGGIAHGPIETHGNGVRHVVVRAPDGNELALAESRAGRARA